MLAVVTILSAAATLVMAVYADRPFALAPGMGLNAFFAYTVIGAMGVPWETALAAIVIEGILFIALTLAGAREYAVLMLGNAADVDWNDPTHAVPAGVTIIAMTLTLSIAYGIAAGIIAYPVMKLAAGERDEVPIGQWLLALAFAGYFALRTSGTLTAI